MATPLRKDDPEFDNQPELIEEEDVIEQDSIEEERITTGDLARTKRPMPVNTTATNPSPAGPARGTQPGSRAADIPQVPARVSQISDAAPLFPNEELEGLRTRWKAIQTAFVDEPRDAVHQADTLVASAMQRLAEVFADERAKLEQQWDRGDSVSTEDLRVALQRYRTFFEHLLSV
jgi:hypothetical protein